MFYFDILDESLIFLLFAPALKGERRKIYLFPLGIQGKTGRFFEYVKVETDTIKSKSGHE